MPESSRRSVGLLLAVGLVAAGVASASTAASTAAPGSAPGSAARSATVAATGRACPAGQAPDHGSLARVASGRVGCAPRAPEAAAELTRAQVQRSARQTAPFTTAAAGAHRAAVQQAADLPATGSGAWQPVGAGPEIGDNPTYPSVAGEGLQDLAGRVQGFSYDPASPTHWFAGVSNGGVYASTDSGASWASIGDTLPTQVVGSVLFTPAGGGTVVAGTGDPAFGGDSLAGLGVYWTSDNGGTWTHSTGVPDDGLTFKVTADPTNASTLYAATSKGLYRSTDAGRSFANVDLPTTCTDPTTAACYFANIVTDVVVRAPDALGKGGGAVLAALGWRAGQKLDYDGKTQQAPQNGLYTSSTGVPGSFAFLRSPAGFTTQASIGRTTLGAAHGAGQNPNDVYAVVEDAQKFNGGASSIDVPEPTGMVPNSTVLDGVYGSTDFGRTWTKLTDADQLKSPTTGTALTGAGSATYAPGVQSWYNSWIEVDPTAGVDALSGQPARVTFGLEEVWESSGSISPVPLTTQFKVVGKYFGGTTCAGLNTAFPACPLTPGSPLPTSTTHPDQHAAMFVPDGTGGVTFVVGNDGGAYSQHVDKGADLSNARWGRGANQGFHTLQPYDAEVAKDGTVVSGLQDNGELRIMPDGRQYEVYGGDGFFTAIDPNDSNVMYEEYTGGDISQSTDGGKNFTDIQPQDVTGSATLVSPMFATPFQMDPTDARHLMVGGRNVFERTTGADGDGTTWVQVYDLGTRKHAGDAAASAADATDHDNQLSAVDVRGTQAYVGFCGFCDLVTQGAPFGNGIATNVGAPAPGKELTSNGWHIAAARGLPRRYVTSVRIDPADASGRTVYATLGGYGRKWVPPGALGDDTAGVGTGHVFRSTDAGESFTDVSGDLPDVTASWSLVEGGRLVVATDLGVFMSSDTAGGSYGRLGGGSLPAVPVVHLVIAPKRNAGDPDRMVAATYGRGVYDYTFDAVTRLGDYHPIQPTRILDTRIGLGSPPAKVGSGRTITVPVTGRAGLGNPVPASATAVVVNTTVTRSTIDSLLRVYPTGTPPPNSSTLNFHRGEQIAALTTVKLGDGGQVDVTNGNGETDVVLDAVGYYTEPAADGSVFHPLAPHRILDTRNGTGGYTTPLADKTFSPVQVTGGSTTVPADATAVVVNTTVADATGSGYLKLWPADGPIPTSSALNFTRNLEIANLDVVGVGSGGRIVLQNSSGTVDAVLDVVGYYTAAGAQNDTGGASFHPVAPTRLFDSRTANGGHQAPLRGGEVATTGLLGRPGLSGITVPTTATAVVATVTVANGSGRSLLKTFPGGSAPGAFSTINWPNGRNLANLAYLTLGPNGTVGLQNGQGTVDAVIDVVGYFSP